MSAQKKAPRRENEDDIATDHGVDIHPREQHHLDHEEHEEHEEHIDERWLVSYSDMMTLLFGLFVMLYSMAVQHKGNLDEKLKEMAEQTFAQNPTPTPPPKVEEQVPKAEFDELQLKLVQIEQDRQKEKEDAVFQKKLVLALQETLAQAKRDTANLQEQLAMQEQSLQQTTQQSRNIASVTETTQQQNEQLQRELDEIKRQKTVLEQEAVRAQQAELKVQEQDRMIAALQKKIEETKPVSKPAVVQPTPPPLNIDPKLLVKELQEKTQEIAQLKKEEKLKEKLEKELIEAQDKIKELEKDKRADGGSFLMFVVKWTTDKHDIDMTVTDPTGRKYDFKKRKYPGQPGEFTLDSRQGPGAEIWQADKFIPGTYQITATLYQNYGNENPAAVEASIVSSMRRVQLPATTLNVSGKMVWKISVNEKGELTVLK